MTGIERRIRDEYGDRYWEQHQDTILSRTRANQTTEKYNSRTKRDMARHPENYSEDELKEAGVWHEATHEADND